MTENTLVTNKKGQEMPVMEKGHRYYCAGGCGREWRGEVGWWVTHPQSILEDCGINRAIVYDAMCPDCYHPPSATP
jgi:hypothetical protein